MLLSLEATVSRSEIRRYVENTVSKLTVVLSKETGLEVKALYEEIDEGVRASLTFSQGKEKISLDFRPGKIIPVVGLTPEIVSKGITTALISYNLGKLLTDTLHDHFQKMIKLELR